MKFPNFDLETFFIENDIAWRKHPALDHEEHAINCPKCQDRGEPTPDTNQKLWINQVRGSFFCYRCSWSGNLTRLVQGVLNTNYLNAIRIVRGRTIDQMDFMNLKLHVDRFEKFDEENIVKEVDLPHGYEPLDEEHPYLKKRGVPLQYAIDHDWGISKAGYTKDRIIVPTFMNDKLVFWQARATWDIPEGDKKTKKVLNPTGASARHVLYNYDTAKEFETVVIVEGFMDCAKVGDNCMATNGKNLHSQQVEWLLQTKAKKIIMLWDNDSWVDGKIVKDKITGKIIKFKPSSMQSAVELLRSASFEVVAGKLPEGRDPGSFKFNSPLLKKIISEAREPKFSKIRN